MVAMAAQKANLRECSVMQVLRRKIRSPLWWTSVRCRLSFKVLVGPCMISLTSESQ